MSLKFEVKKKHVSRSERVKSVELHPDMPWVLSALYSGNVTIQDYSTQTTVKTIEVSQTQSPVRNAKFVARKQWIVCVSDDHQVRVFNYNTNEKIKQFEAHTDYIRYILVHPTQSYFMTSSDDTTIKLWDWEKNFSCVRSFEDHVNYVMQLSWNPRDTNTFASASMDRSIKVWIISNPKANFTLQGHEGGVNAVDFHRGDKPYLISGGDDRVIKIWDYQTKQCIHTLEAHQNNISAVVFHPDLPLIISTAEDGVIRFWHANTYKLETSLNYNMDRVWCLDLSRDNSIAFGFDEGTVVVKIGQDEPVVSMSQGKVVFAKNFEIIGINLKAVGVVQDGQVIQTQTKELGISDIYPSGIRHSPNGHMFAVFSDSEYLIYRANFKNSGFGEGTDLVWSPSGDYAVRSSFSIKLFKNNTLAYEMKTDFQVEQLYSGPLLCARGSEFVIFYDWETAKVIRRIDVVALKVIWNDQNTLVALATSEEVFVLRFFMEQMPLFIEAEEQPDGFEDAFDPLFEIAETITSGIWIHDVFYFTTTAKFGYSVGPKVFQFSNVKAFILGYLQSQNRLYLIDKSNNITSYHVNYQVAEFQSLVYNKQMPEAKLILDQIPDTYHDQLAKFLDTLQQRELAYSLVKDQDLKFELALQLGKVQDAYSLAGNDTLKMRSVGDLALQQGRIKLAVEALEAAEDLPGLLLIYSSLGLKQRLLAVGQKALDQMKMNIAFTAFFTCSDLPKCLEVLVKSNRFTEAAFFAKTYCPSKITEMVTLWKESLAKSHPVISQKIANPLDDPNNDFTLALKLEKFYEKQYSKQIPAHRYLQIQEQNIDLMAKLRLNPDIDLSQFEWQ